MIATPNLAKMDAADDRARMKRFGKTTPAAADKAFASYIKLLDANTDPITDAIRAKLTILASRTTH